MEPLAKSAGNIKNDCRWESNTCPQRISNVQGFEIASVPFRGKDLIDLLYHSHFRSKKYATFLFTDCPSPIPPNNPAYWYSYSCTHGTQVGSTCTFVCYGTPAFSVVPDITCLPSGMWSSPPGGNNHCVAPSRKFNHFSFS